MGTVLGDIATFGILVGAVMGFGYIGFEVGLAHGRKRGYDMCRVEYDEDRPLPPPVADVASSEAAPQ